MRRFQFFQWWLSLVLWVIPSASIQAEVNPIAKLMPRGEDYTLMWWAEGFPKVVEGAPWLRIVQTGHYAMALDTEAMQVRHLGPVPSGTDYEAFGRAPYAGWGKTSPADLVLTISVNGKSYRCTRGGKWNRYGGPRLIEAGRFFQRADVTDLVFTAADGEELSVEARFETAAWADRLGLILLARPKVGSGASWKEASMIVSLSAAKGGANLRSRWNLAPGQIWSSRDWQQVALSLDPVSFEMIENESRIRVVATERSSGKKRTVDYDHSLGWHCVNLDRVPPIAPSGVNGPSNDALERVKLVLSNPSKREGIARLMFEKNARGFAQNIGSPITGISAILRDVEGNPIGLPVQLSKNWHTNKEGGVYASQWFHGLTQLRLPPESTTELELTIAYGHWGGVAAASHAQLSLIGWGSNQLWHQSALGSWGESICFEPEQGQANCSITDVRPVMVNGGEGEKKWKWTDNMGGGDFFRLFNREGKRVPHSAMRTTNLRQGPCLTETTYAGVLGKGITHSSTVSLARTDDLVRGIYRVRLDVRESTEFSRFVVFQVGADTYNYTREAKLAIGNESGLIKEWDAEWGGNVYRTEPIACKGVNPWMSLHERAPDGDEKHKGGANRGIIIRSWKARIGGKEAKPWVAERGLTRGQKESSTVDILLPPGTKRLEAGDFIEATFEHLVIPQFAEEYYGPRKSLRAVLDKNGNTWRMVHREAKYGARSVKMKSGELERRFPDVRIAAENEMAEFELSGGLGYVPITVTNLSTANRGILYVNGKPLDQSVHGSDFWQTDYDARTRRWSRTYNIPATRQSPLHIHFKDQ